MKDNRLLVFWSCCAFLMMVPSFGEAQNTGQKAKAASPSLIRKELNKISDPRRTLEPFYNKLNKLPQIQRQAGAKKEITPNVVSIMHIGDSHIQAGFLSVTVMNRLQQRFGSAGRGLIFPLKLARTNEPYDYLIRSESKWNKSLCVQRTHKIPMGLGGLSIETDDEQFTFEIRASVGNNDTDHSFNKVTVFHHEKAPELVVTDQGIDFHSEKSKYAFASVVSLNKRVNKLHLTSTVRSEKDSAIYYGFNLENGKSGILYHAVGLNGAQFRHYASAQHFAQQMTILAPQLFIFSLGTNEAFRGKLMEKYFFAEIDRIIEPIHKANPQASILITTPPDCLGANVKKTQSSNVNISYVRQSLIRYATSKGYAYWDLYSILGGDNSAYKLYQAGYLAEDGVHFKKDGYTILGNLFYDALISNYSDYVQRRSQ